MRGRYGVVFTNHAQVLWVIRVPRYKAYRKQITSQGTQYYIAGTGAVVVQTIKKLSREQEQKQKPCLTAQAGRHDKLINYTDRVSG